MTNALEREAVIERLTALKAELVAMNEDIEKLPLVDAPAWRRRAFTDEQARTVFLTLVLTGVRRFELQGLRWRDVDLVDTVLRVRESKSEEGERSIALSPPLAEALWQHRRRSAFQGEDELVFCHPTRGSKIDHEWFAGEFRAALTAAGITDYVRPFHDLRHCSLTNGAAAGEAPLALMSRAGHRSMSTTNAYLHLAGVVFRDEADALARRMLGTPQLSTAVDKSRDVTTFAVPTGDGSVGAKLHPTELTSADLTRPEPA